MGILGKKTRLRFTIRQSIDRKSYEGKQWLDKLSYKKDNYINDCKTSKKKKKHQYNYSYSNIIGYYVLNTSNSKAKNVITHFVYYNH